MITVGARCTFLKASDELRKALQTTGRKANYSPGQTLFREDEGNSGVYLLLKGKLRMTVRGLPKLDRLFSAGSVLGLPSTFTGHAYSLTAQAITEVDAIHVPSDIFLQLVREQPELCREATEMLGREVTFIQSALAERRKQAAKARVSPAEIGALV
jgi:CRP-like cAMP-binding protein